MISKQFQVTGYSEGYYKVGEFTPPRWVDDGLAKPITGATPRYGDGRVVAVPEGIVEQLRGIGDAVYTGTDETAERTRDWWPGTMLAHTDGAPATPDAVIVEASGVKQVQAVLRLAAANGIPVTVAAGRSNVTGSTLPLEGGIVLDIHTMNSILGFNPTDLTAECEPGVFGDVLEERLQTAWGVTTGHWPQSLGLSTVGGWVACRGAGQLSTRYGKVEDMVTELDVVLPSGELVTLGGRQRAAVGPDLKQLFIGSEGMLGVITRVVLRTHALPDYARYAAYEYDTFEAGLDACRRIMQRGVTPAALRLWDNMEGDYYFGNGGNTLLLILDEGDPRLVDVTVDIASDEAATTGTAVDAEPIFQKWLATRFEVPAQNAFEDDGAWMADTLEMTAGWSQLPRIYQRVQSEVGALEGTFVVSAHQSHAYTDAACVYFTIQGTLPIKDRAAWYRAVWDVADKVIIEEHGQLSHHHGVGVVRTPYVAESLGGGMEVLRAVKQALDPGRMLNPGKYGL